MLHLLLYLIAAGDDRGLRRQVLRTLIPASGGTLILVCAAFTGGWTQVGIWGLALVWDYVGVLAIGVSGWRLRSAAHWSERHGLVVIIALGESIVSIGVGVLDKPISWAIIVASALGVAVAAMMWWVYFGQAAARTEHTLARARGDHRVRLAAHGYTYLHLPLIGGIILMALGLKKVLTYVGDPEHYSLAEALHGIGPYALFGGVALYLLGHVAFCLRVLGTVQVSRVVAALLLLALIPLAGAVPALAALCLLTAVLTCLVGWETARRPGVGKYLEQRVTATS